MLRMSDWALPFRTLSLSLVTSSSSGPRGGNTGWTHHGLHSDTIFILEKMIIFRATYYALIDGYNVPGGRDGKDMKGTYLNRPEPNKELVLQEYGEDEEYNTFSCHRKQILPYKVPLKRVKSRSCACREEPHK